MICPVYHLPSIWFVNIWFVLYIICPLYGLSTYDLSCISFALYMVCLHMICPPYDLSYIRFVLIWLVLSMICHAYYFSFKWFFLHKLSYLHVSYYFFVLHKISSENYAQQWVGKISFSQYFFLKKNITIFSYYTFFSIILIASVWILLPLYNSFVSSFFIKKFTFLYKFGLKENKKFGLKKRFYYFTKSVLYYSAVNKMNSNYNSESEISD